MSGDDDESRGDGDQEVDLQHVPNSRPNFYLDLDDDAFEDRDDDAEYTFSPEEVRAQLARNLALSEEPESADDDVTAMHLQSPDPEVEETAISLERSGLYIVLYTVGVLIQPQAPVYELRYTFFASIIDNV